jgi:hypothetical protein
MGYMSSKGFIFAVIGLIASVVAIAKRRVAAGVVFIVVSLAIAGVSLVMARNSSGES